MPNTVTSEEKKEKTAVHVKVEVDMTDYCIALRAYLAALKTAGIALKNTEFSIDQRKQDFNEASLQTFNERNPEIVQTVRQEKEKLSDLVRGIAGSMHGNALINTLMEALKAGSDEQQALAKILHETNKPLAFECAETCYVEILKNSMDAVVDLGVQTGLAHHMKLQMTIQVELLSDERVAISFRDNGAGFSDDFLRHFDDYISKKKYLSEVHPSRKSLSPFYFGGRGRGIGMICAILLEGIETGGATHKSLYERSACANNGVFVSNENGGAQIQLVSTLSPVTWLMDLEETSHKEFSLDRLDGSSGIESPQSFNGSAANYSVVSSVSQHSIFRNTGRPLSVLDPALLANCSTSNP